jgi:hypothetical protein
VKKAAVIPAQAAKAGCRSEHSRSEWPEGRAAEVASQSMLIFGAKSKMDSRLRGNDV